MSEVNHTGRAHALLSASGASRWINCTPSARLEEKYDVSTSSTYAQEGELAHELSELMLSLELKHIDQKIFNREFKKIQSNKLYEDDMLHHCETYVNYVMEQITSHGVPYADVQIEQRLDFSHIVPMGFGTGDANIPVYAKRFIEITDLKYGKGVRVSAENNPQLRLYALGALQEAEIIETIDYIKMTIVQPRLDNISSEIISVADLVLWAENIVRPAAQLAHRGDGQKRAGEWCKFCKVKPTCPALADKSLEIARADFEDPHVLSVERLVALRSQFDMITDWIASVEKYLLDKALKGDPLPGLKLVEGRSNRKWGDEQEVISRLKLMKFKKADFMDEKLKGIPAIEKLLKPDQLEKIKGEIIKPEGKPTLVPESDPRPARGIAQAQADFAE